VSTYPTSGYDLGEVLTGLATGEAIITVMNEKGAPSPVAWTRLRAPQGSMAPTPAAEMQATVDASPLTAQYGTVIDRESAHEILAVKMNAAADAAARVDAEKTATAQAKEAARIQADYDKAVRDMQRASAPKRTTSGTTTRTTRTSRANQSNPIEDVLGSRTGQTVVREVLRGIFSTLKRK
jgi:hypothetical protein